MWEYLADTLKQPGESKEAAWERYVRSFIPLGRAQTPDDIGSLAVYLASAENVTGPGDQRRRRHRAPLSGARTPARRPI